MARKVPNEVQKVFDKYTVNFVRRLSKEKALEMFRTDFGLCEDRAQHMFKTFDQDHNDQLSIWEFYHFYTAFGKDANDYLSKFESIQTDGKADVAETWDFLKTLKTLAGRTVSDPELECLIKGFAGEDRSLDKTKFTELICKIKMTRTREADDSSQTKQNSHAV